MYRLYLLARQIALFEGKQKDRATFFGHESPNTELVLKQLRSDATACQTRLGGRSAWFLKPKANLSLGKNKIGPGQIFGTAGSKLAEVLKTASADLKFVLGDSYESAYSVPSRSIHMNVGGMPRNHQDRELEQNKRRVGFLGLHAARLAFELAGLQPDGEAKQVIDALAYSGVASLSPEPFSKGDIVLAYDCPGHVHDVKPSPFGNFSYGVRYFGKSPVPEIVEDWFPAAELHLVVRQRDQRSWMVESLQKLGFPEDLLKALFAKSDEEIRAAIFETLVEMGALGIGPRSTWASEEKQCR